MVDDYREGLCERCGRDYPVWFAPNELWNTVMRPNGEASEVYQFICMDCFALYAEKQGVRPTAWILSIDPTPTTTKEGKK